MERLKPPWATKWVKTHPGDLGRLGFKTSKQKVKRVHFWGRALPWQVLAKDNEKGESLNGEVHN